MRLYYTMFPFGPLSKDDCFEVARAVYWYCHDYHTGQGSVLYEILSQTPYVPSFSERGVKWEYYTYAEGVYDSLVDGTIKDVKQLAEYLKLSLDCKG